MYNIKVEKVADPEVCSHLKIRLGLSRLAVLLGLFLYLLNSFILASFLVTATFTEIFKIIFFSREKFRLKMHI